MENVYFRQAASLTKSLQLDDAVARISQIGSHLQRLGLSLEGSPSSLESSVMAFLQKPMTVDALVRRIWKVPQNAPVASSVLRTFFQVNGALVSQSLVDANQKLNKSGSWPMSRGNVERTGILRPDL